MVRSIDFKILQMKGFKVKFRALEKIGLSPRKVLEILKKGTNPVKLGDKHLTVRLSEKSSSPKWQKGSINLA